MRIPVLSFIAHDVLYSVKASICPIDHVRNRCELRNHEAADCIRAVCVTVLEWLYEKAPGIVLLDERKDGGYPTAVTEASGQDPVYIGRIREDISHANGLNLWVVADNVRKGAALNSVQIAEVLVEKYL